MDGLFSTITVIVRLGNLVLAGYLLSILAPLYCAEKHASFSRTIQLMLIAIIMFLVVEMTFVARCKSIAVCSVLKNSWMVALPKWQRSLSAQRAFT